MSTIFAELLHQASTPEISDMPTARRQGQSTEPISGWDPTYFAERQVHNLVRQVFLPGWPSPARQVVLCDLGGTDVESISLKIAHALAALVCGNVGVLNLNPARGESKPEDAATASRHHPIGLLRQFSEQISSNLWCIPQQVFGWGAGDFLSAEWLPARMRDLSMEFDYSIITAPAGQGGEIALLGHFSDGVILVLRANFTRKMAAQKLRQTLRAANAKLLGVVLDQRSFPIPKGIYSKL